MMKQLNVGVIGTGWCGGIRAMACARHALVESLHIAETNPLRRVEIEQMVKDAEANAEADKERRELADAKNQAESLIHGTEKSLEEHSDKVGPETVEAIELAVANLKEQIETDDAGKIRTGIQNLAEASMKLGEAVYKAEQEKAEAAGDGGDGQKPDDEIVDADFEDLDSGKRD